MALTLQHEDCLKLLCSAIKHPYFRKANPHLSHDEYLKCLYDVPQFPSYKPVFSPYAPAKSVRDMHHVGEASPMFGTGYSQVKHKDVYASTRFYIHRVACQYKNGLPPTSTSQASHRMEFPNDFNPNNLVWEEGKMNRSRLFCTFNWERLAARADLTFEQRKAEHQKTCRLVHKKRCRFWNPAWGEIPYATIPKMSGVKGSPNLRGGMPSVNRKRGGRPREDKRDVHKRRKTE